MQYKSYLSYLWWIFFEYPGVSVDKKYQESGIGGYIHQHLPLHQKPDPFPHSFTLSRINFKLTNGIVFHFI